MDKKTVMHVLNALRLGTLTWSGRREALEKVREKKQTNHVIRYSKDKKKNFTLKKVYKYRCAHCRDWFRDYEVQVDHIVEVGGYDGDWNEIIERMYDKNNLQILCVQCHKEKTASFVASDEFVRRKKL